MIEGESIVCMPLTTWDSDFPNTTVKIMSLLSKKNKILFVDYQFTFKDLYSSIIGLKKIPIKRIVGIEPRLRKVKTEFDSELFVLNPPPVFPYNGIPSKSFYHMTLSLNASIVKASVRKALKILDMKDVITVNGYNPFMGLPLKGAFNEKLHVYYCYDEIRGDIWHKNHGPAIEEEYLKKVDVVVTTSDALHSSKSCFNSNCFVVKNGVDFDLFYSVFNSDISNRDKVVGYTGSVDERFDYELMTYVIEKLPGIKFYFIGRVTNPIAKQNLEKFPNVKFLGSKHPNEIPGYLKDIDVCIIPYLKNEVTKGVYPLKINEYLAAGKPVVMTDFASLNEFNDVVCFAKDKEEFLKYLVEELSSDLKEKKIVRTTIAKSNSWQHRVEEFSDIIERTLTEREKLYI